MKPSLARIRHARSKKDFPYLNLEEHEYVELAIMRSKKGLAMILAGGLVAMLALGVIAILLIGAISRTKAIEPETMHYFLIFLVSLYAILIVSLLIAAKVYLANKLFVTNKRVIHFSQSSLLAKSMNVIELSRIEDVSFKQEGLLAHLLSFGTLRMSTVGDETTYTFQYVDTPEDELTIIAHLIHKAKNNKK
jgi:hypothetical protein